jgi:hypothetical protein
VAVNSIYASIIPSYKYNLVLKSFSYGTQVMGYPVQLRPLKLKFLKKNDVSQSLVSLINDNYLLYCFEVFLVTSKKQGNAIIESKVVLYSIKTSSHIFVS